MRIICWSPLNHKTERPFFFYLMWNKPSGNDTGAMVLLDDPQFSFGRGNSCPYLNVFRRESVYYLPSLLDFLRAIRRSGDSITNKVAVSVHVWSILDLSLPSIQKWSNAAIDQTRIDGSERWVSRFDLPFSEILEYSAGIACKYPRIEQKDAESIWTFLNLRAFSNITYLMHTP